MACDFACHGSLCSGVGCSNFKICQSTNFCNESGFMANFEIGTPDPLFETPVFPG